MKDGLGFLVSGLLAPLALGLLGAVVGLRLVGTVVADLVSSEDPVFLARGLR